MYRVFFLWQAKCSRFLFCAAQKPYNLATPFLSCVCVCVMREGFCKYYDFLHFVFGHMGMRDCVYWLYNDVKEQVTTILIYALIKITNSANSHTLNLIYHYDFNFLQKKMPLLLFVCFVFKLYSMGLTLSVCFTFS